MTPDNIPFNRPCLTGNESGYISNFLQSPELTSYAKSCEALLEEQTNAHRVLLTNSCTHALEVAAVLSGIGPGDEVIVPSFTFTSTATPFALRGARIIFVDIQPSDMNMSVDAMEAAITKKTKAIIPVHYAGAACDMPRILDVARKYNLIVIEDAAQCIGSSLYNKALGTYGALGAYSFHASKNLGCHQGGALLVNDAELLKRAEIVLDKGTTRAQFLKGETRQYDWVDLGVSAPPSELQAAFLFAQLEQADIINQKRLYLWGKYCLTLKPLTKSQPFRLLNPHPGHNAHILGLLFDTSAQRDKAKKALASNGIQTALHYQPLHLSPAGQAFGEARGSMSESETLPYRLLRLPLWHELPDNIPERVAKILSNL